ncbi:uncharacterized protein LOC108904872 [Anoplophora glabripennis]|uniref:uncharacterized protein LOC108904872 n=1 Tax=Anoplophora glabripennis TaxID=217634 RepID=UPI0008757B8B|nr:uncharacterized protein LOC108904872 [Anoplophora glabripennis]
MEWSNDLVLRFLELYEEEPTIWNPKHPDHKNRHLAHDAWKRIEIKLDSRWSVTELKKKKDALMATYRKLLHKLNAIHLNGTDAYRPEWFAFDHMERFLHNVYRPNVTRNPEVLKLEGPVLIETESTNQVESDESIDEDEIDENIKTEVNPLSTTNFTKQISNSKPTIQSIMKRKRRVQSMAAAKARRAESYQVFKKLARPRSLTSDECSLYSELLATKLRALDENTRAFAMLQIDHFMFRLRQEKNGIQKAPSCNQMSTNSWFPQCFPHLHVSDSGLQTSARCAHQLQPSPRHYSRQPSPQGSQSSASIISPLPPPSPSIQSPSQQSREGSPRSNQSIEDFDPLMAL